jgi:hypothetical protein
MIKAKVCATMSVVDEFALVEASLSRLEAAYPHAERVLLVDAEAADVIDRWRRLSDSRTVVHRATGIYRHDRGGAVVDLHLRSFMSSDAEWWIKMDPDTFVRHPFESLPRPTSFSGTLQTGLPRPSLQGGCIVGGRKAIACLLRSEVLSSRTLLDYHATWAAGNGVLLRRVREHGLVSFDFVHAWACERAGVPLENYSEINSQWLRPPVDGARYAVTHPHKQLDAVDRPRESEAAEYSPKTDLEALLTTILPADCAVAIVGRSQGTLSLPHARSVRILVRENTRLLLEAQTASEEAITRVHAAMAQGVTFIVIPASARAWFGSCCGFAEYLLNHYEVVFWQDDLALIFDLSRPSLIGPHMAWYQSSRRSDVGPAVDSVSRT